MVRKTRLSIVLLAALTACPALGAPLIYEPFDYSSVGAELSTADGSVPGIWDKVAAGTTLEPTIASGSLSYAGLPWTPAGNSVAMTGGTTAVQASSTRQIPGNPYLSANEPTLYYSMLFRVTDIAGTVGQNAATGGSFVAGFRRDSGTGALASNLDVGAPLLIRTGSVAGSTYQLGTGLTANTGPVNDRVWSTTDYTQGQTLLLVLAYEFVSGGEDFARLWVNPDPNLSEFDNASELKVTATATDGHGINTGTIRNIFLRNNGSAPDGFVIDELRVATSWEDVMSIPEPGALSLLSLAAFAAAMRRSR